MKKTLAIIGIFFALSGCALTQTKTADTVEIPNGWVEYRNTFAHYTMWHPATCRLSEMASSDNDITEAGDIRICDLILLLDRAEDWPNDPAIAKPLKLSFPEFAKYIWSQNKNDINPNLPNKAVSSLEKTSVGLLPAFSFNIDSSYIGVRGGFTLQDENTLVMFSDGSYYYIAIYQSKDVTAKQILLSFTSLR